ncbi:TetR family transcriptional regulator [Actinopolyspora mortivallis]|uniref:TetR family transcriptional regulator n=1 Tax=Actinopolyspora mortivallis TaxID=33906 RepID=A0A2T0GTC3_ACTMO|nr:TetR family transcriptional regulator [Actinopolyspora mortivallis]
MLEATVSLLAERGVEAMTMDAVASTAGVSRSTLYRHWPERLPLLIDAVEHLGIQLRDTSPETADSEGELEAELQRVIGQLGAGLRSPRWGAIAGSLAVASEHDETLAEVYRAYVHNRRQEVISVLRRAQRDGELADSIDLEWAVSLLAGPIYYHRLVLHQPLDEQQVTEHVEHTVALLRAEGGR